MTDAPRVFVSYSHDSDEHATRVLALADALCTDGIDVILDRYVHPAPEQGWPRWMDQNIEAARFVLLVCTDTYRRRAMGLEDLGKGLGVDWEGNLIFNSIYHRIENNQPSGSRFIPILLPGSKPDHIPTPLLGHTRYQIASFGFTDLGFEALYRHLTDQPATPRPDLGTIKFLPPIPRPEAVPGPLPPSGGPESSVRPLNTKAPPYVVKVSGKRKDGQYFYGTGFILTSNGLVATCRDVIKDAEGDILVKLPTQEEPWLCHVKEVDKDLALLRVLRADDSVKPRSTSVADLDPNWVKGNVRDEEITCYCWGSSNLDSPDDPQRINGKFSNFDRGLIFLELDADVNLADSGAPVLNANNKVIGIVNYCQTKVVGSAVARTVSWFVRIKSEQHEGLESIETSETFKNLLEAISDAKGDFVLFIGPGISFSLYKHLAQCLFSLKYFTEKNVRMQDLVGVPCLTCHHSAGPDTPKECPLLKDIEREEDCPLYREQILAVTMANIRDLSQYATAESHSSVNLYNQIFDSLDSCLRSDVGVDLLNTNKRIARSISMYMIPLIITTNLDNELEKALKDQKIGFHRIIFDPSWNEEGAFVHKISGEIKEIGSDAKWPKKAKGDNMVIILKLCGTYEHKGGDQPFILASKHFDRLIHCISAKKLPNIIIEKLKKTILFIGHSPNDPELQQILEAILAAIGPTKFKGKSYFIHQCKPGFLGESLYKNDFFENITFVGLRDDMKRVIEVIST